MTRKKEILFGVSSLLIILFAYFGFKFLKGNNLLSSDHSYYLEFDQIQNLQSSSRIKFSGLNIGKIIYIKLNPKNRQIKLKVNISNDIEIPNDSYLMIKDGGLIEAPHLELNFGKSTTFYKNGDLIEGRYETSVTEILKAKAPVLTESLTNTLTSSDSLLLSMQAIINDKNSQLLHLSLKNIERLSAEMAKLGVTMNQAFGEKEQNLKTTAKNLSHITSNLSKLTDSLAQRHWQNTFAQLDTISHELQHITAKLNRTDNTLGKMLNEDTLYHTINGTMQEARELMYDIKMNPERYLDFSIFSSDREPYKKPKKQPDSTPNQVSAIQH